MRLAAGSGMRAEVVGVIVALALSGCGSRNSDALGGDMVEELSSLAIPQADGFSVMSGDDGWRMIQVIGENARVDFLIASHLRDFAHELDSTIEFYCIGERKLMHSGAKRELRRLGLKECVIEDSARSLTVLNPGLSSKDEFVCLVDSSGLILASGNPLRPRERQPYYDAVNRGMPTGSVELSCRDFQLGKLPGDTVIERVVKLMNTGAVPVKVYGDWRSCGCTGVTIAGNYIEPGDSAVVELTYTPSKPGKFTSAVFLYTSAEGSPHIVKLTSVVED